MKMDAPTNSSYENETLPATADFWEIVYFPFAWINKSFIVLKSKAEVMGQSPHFGEISQNFSQ